MKREWRYVLACLCGAVVGVRSARADTVHPAQPVRTIPLEEAVALALQRNPDAISSEHEVRRAEATRAIAAGAFGPRLQVDADARRWNGAFDLDFGGATVRARDAFTWSVSVSVIQPLTPLLLTYEQYKVGDLGVDVAKIERKVKRQDIALRVVTAYYRLLEAGRLSEVAEASIGQLSAQEKQAQSLLTNGVIGKNDLLRATLALANAKQRAIQSRGQLVLAQGELNVAMGYPTNEAVQAAPLREEGAIAAPSSLQLVEQQATQQRVELRALELRIQGIEAELRLARKKYLPSVNLVGNYAHIEGSTFQEKNSAYVGAVGSWNVWDWGSTQAGVDEAHARLQRARAARDKVRDEVQFEARQAFVGAETAREALNVARSALTQAEENFRLVTKRFENNTATAFDVVDAEALLTQSRGQVETALYDLLIAQQTLKRATGATLPGET